MELMTARREALSYPASLATYLSLSTLMKRLSWAFLRIVEDVSLPFYGLLGLSLCVLSVVH